MTIEIDTHAHTLVSGHAYNTMREMVQMAAEKGLKGLALTEHAPKMPGSTNLYYFENLGVVPRKMYGIDVLLGSELNILDAAGSVDLPKSVLRKLDIAIASIHTLCFEDEWKKEPVTEAYLNAMENPWIDVIGHPDDGRFPVDYPTIVKKAKETGTLLELNNSSLRPGGFRQNTKENAIEMLRCCKELGAKIVLGSDAHVDASIADCTWSEPVLREVDFPEELIVNTSIVKLKEALKRNKKL